ncbi:hypothetical protein [Microbacterium sp. NPDC089696]
MPADSTDLTVAPEPRSHLIANFAVFVPFAALAMLATYLLAGAP